MLVWQRVRIQPPSFWMPKNFRECQPTRSKTLQAAWAIPLQSGRVHAVASQGKSCARPYSLQQGESGISRGKWYRLLVVSSHLIHILYLNIILVKLVHFPRGKKITNL